MVVTLYADHVRGENSPSSKYVVKELRPVWLEYLCSHLVRVLDCGLFCSPTEAERNQDQTFSGLYSFHVPSNTWTKLMDDCSQLRSRIGHSMLFHPVRQPHTLEPFKNLLSVKICSRLDTEIC